MTRFLLYILSTKSFVKHVKKCINQHLCGVKACINTSIFKFLLRYDFRFSWWELVALLPSPPMPAIETSWSQSSTLIDKLSDPLSFSKFIKGLLRHVNMIFSTTSLQTSQVLVEVNLYVNKSEFEHIRSGS